MAAGVAVLEALADGSVYEKIEALGQALSDGLAKAAAAAGVSVQLQRIGSMSCCYFADAPVYNMTDAMQSDRDRFAKYFQWDVGGGGLHCPVAIRSRVYFRRTR